MPLSCTTLTSVLATLLGLTLLAGCAPQGDTVASLPDGEVVRDGVVNFLGVAFLILGLIGCLLGFALPPLFLVGIPLVLVGWYALHDEPEAEAQDEAPAAAANGDASEELEALPAGADPDDPAVQKRLAAGTKARVLKKLDEQLRPERRRQLGIVEKKRIEIKGLMAKTAVASHEELLRRANESVELLHLKNLIEEAAMAQRAGDWLDGKIRQHEMLAEQLRSQIERLDSVVALRGVASPEELKEIRSVVNGAVAAVEESLSVPEREDDAALAAKLFTELRASR
jgi:hypothetical protein